MIRFLNPFTEAAKDVAAEVLGESDVRIESTKDIAALQSFQDRVLDGNLRAGTFVAPRTMAERTVILEQGGRHLAAHAPDGRIVGSLACCYAPDLAAYEERLCLSQSAGRGALTSDPALVLTTGLVDRWLHGRNVMVALLEEAEAEAVRLGCATLAFVAAYDNLPMLRAGFSAGYRIIGCGVHRTLGNGMYLYERRLVPGPEVAAGEAFMALDRKPVDQIAFETMLDDDYAVTSASFSRRVLTLQKWSFEQSLERTPGIAA